MLRAIMSHGISINTSYANWTTIFLHTHSILSKKITLQVYGLDSFLKFHVTPYNSNTVKLRYTEFIVVYTLLPAPKPLVSLQLLCTPSRKERAAGMPTNDPTTLH